MSGPRNQSWYKQQLVVLATTHGIANTTRLLTPQVVANKRLRGRLVAGFLKVGIHMY